MASAYRASSPMQANAGTTSGLTAVKPALQSVIKLFLLLIAQLPLIHASPIGFSRFNVLPQEADPMHAHNPTLWVYFIVAIALVLLGGAFAGLTIALMGQVSSKSGVNAMLAN